MNNNNRIKCWPNGGQHLLNVFEFSSGVCVLTTLHNPLTDLYTLNCLSDIDDAVQVLHTCSIVLCRWRWLADSHIHTDVYW